MARTAGLSLRRSWSSVRYSNRRAVQAIGRIDRGADQNEGVNRTLVMAQGMLNLAGRAHPAQSAPSCAGVSPSAGSCPLS
jgi:hypothetical protein